MEYYIHRVKLYTKVVPYTFNVTVVLPPRWTKNGMSVLSDPSLVPLSLVLYNVNEDHNGNYVCHGTTTISIPFKEQAEVFVGGS